jgi:hypothetical protein
MVALVLGAKRGDAVFFQGTAHKVPVDINQSINQSIDLQF